MVVCVKLNGAGEAGVGHGGDHQPERGIGLEFGDQAAQGVDLADADAVEQQGANAGCGGGQVGRATQAGGPIRLPLAGAQHGQAPERGADGGAGGVEKVASQAHGLRV